MYHKKSIEETLEQLKSSAEGLDAQEAKSRLEKNGYNELAEGKKKSIPEIFISQFKDLLVIILLISVVISLFTGNQDSAIVIICVLIMNAIIGTVQNVKAEKSLAALKAMSSPMAKVMRNGIMAEIPARELCVGDIMILEAGDIAAADGRIIEAVNLSSDESSLTGESLAVEKLTEVLTGEKIPVADRRNMIYSGSKITNGRGIAVVTATGMETEIGKIAELLNAAKEKQTPLQKELDNFSKILSIGIIVICAIVMGMSLLRGETLMNALMFAVALAVAAIPEALSSIVTISLAIGTQKMAAENAIVKELKAVESLGCVNVICSDKTGTLTQNKMTVRDVYGDKSQMIKLAMALCNDAVFGADGMIGDPTEIALLNYCSESFCKKAKDEHPRLGELPFDSDRKLMSTLHDIDEKFTIFTKGAPDVILDRVTHILDNGSVRKITDSDREKIKKQNAKYSGDGMRVLGYAYKNIPEERTLDFEDENDLTFIGLSAMTDPPRPESKEAVAKCIGAGIKPVMITGDHKVTAVAIAKEIGIFRDGDLAYEGAELDDISDDELIKLLPKISVYARVSPAHKIRIVELWQKAGKIVSMTGDGVNDAPALKKADVGVAMGITGTQVSKDAASIVLTDDNFATIIKAVANGRIIYRNIKNAIKFLLMGNFAAIIAVMYCVFAGLQMPFTPVHLLFINLLTDSLPAIAISTERGAGDVLKQKPRKQGEGILNKKSLFSIVSQGIILSISTIIAYYIGNSISPESATTMSFAVLCLGRLFLGFGCRSDRPLYKIGLFTNRFSVIAFVAGAVLLSCALFIPGLHGILDTEVLDTMKYIMIVVLAIAPSIISQIGKTIRQSYYAKNK